MNSNNWQSELDEFLAETEQDVFVYLKKIKNGMDESGVTFDERFRKHFLQLLGNR